MPFDTTATARPYMREGTAALAALVATRPARDVLASIAAELQHRDRPAARKLAAEVAALLGGVMPSDAAPVAPVAPPASAPVAAPDRPLGEILAAVPPAELLAALAGGEG